MAVLAVFRTNNAELTCRHFAIGQTLDCQVSCTASDIIIYWYMYTTCLQW